MLALVDDGAAEPVAQVVGQFEQLLVPVDLDRHFGGIADDKAVVAPRQVFVQFGLGPVVNGTVQVIGELFQEVRAIHFDSPLFAV